MPTDMKSLIDGDFKTFDKLKGYEPIIYDNLVADMHIRYVRKDFKTKQLKCTFAVVSSCEAEQPIKLRSYVPWDSNEPPRTWELQLKSLNYVRFYKKKPSEKKEEKKTKHK
jgi:hypothetical protein